MTEFAWDAEVEKVPEHETGPESETEPQDAAPAVVTLTVDDFSALEERILRAVDVVRRERQARAAAEERASRAEAQLHDHAQRVEYLEKDLHLLRAERDHVRERVERLLGQLDALEL